MSIIALYLFLLATDHVLANDALKTPSKDCPLWTTLQNDSCKCGSDAFGLVQCEDARGAFGVTNCYCMTTDKNNTSPLVGSCYYACEHLLTVDTHYKLEVNTTQDLDIVTCRHYNRTGVMCGKCIEGYGLPVYSYSLSCVECSHYKYNWLKYIAVAYIPLTLFYFMVIIFRISATSGLMAGYITVCQLLTIHGVIVWVQTIQPIITPLYLYLLLPIWNLDFFRSFYNPFCLHPKLSALHVFMLDYAVALYPLILILLTYFAVKLHDQFKLVVWLCKPLTACFFCFRKEWNIKNSLVEAFAAFYILSYVKILNTSADILKQVELLNMTSHFRTVYFHDPSLSYFGKGHYPYAIVAIILFVLFNILPLLVLCLYPCHCFHRCLNKTGCTWQALHVFMDAILGAYSHRPRERRYYGAIYIALRLFNMLAFASLNFVTYLQTASYIMIVAIVLVSAFQPYRNKWHNVIDVILFSAMLNGTLAAVFQQEARIYTPHNSHIIDYWMGHGYVAMAIILIYGLFALFAIFLPKKFIWQLLTQLSSLRKKSFQLIESFPYRMEHNESDPLRP